MSLSCPACRKANQTRLACERCGCDLTDLQRVAQAASMALAQGLERLRAADWPRALDLAEASWRLQHSQEAARLAFVAAAASGATLQALTWYGRAAPPAATGGG